MRKESLKWENSKKFMRSNYINYMRINCRDKKMGEKWYRMNEVMGKTRWRMDKEWGNIINEMGNNVVNERKDYIVN